MDNDQKITLGHGSGGRLTRDLIRQLFLQNFDNCFLAPLNDSAILEIGGVKLAFTTDSHVVQPLFYPGGDIGRLAVCGTVNDLAVMGAAPHFLSCAYIIEENFGFETLELITRSMAGAALEAGVKIVTGDTKVVEHGKGDGLFINTAGIGKVVYELPKPVKPGDKILVNGPIGNHEIAILIARGGLDIKVDLQSDCAPLNGLISSLWEVSDQIRFMRDPTRGGLATVLNELVTGQDFGVLLFEDQIPVLESVQGVCSLLGFDPLYLANEGKVVIIVSPEQTDQVLDRMLAHPLGKDARIIGEIVNTPSEMVCLRTISGGIRILDMLTASQLPRIC
ncbi:hydrogenase expression/formation protein HypE [bacterium]|nr:hydrogenase expression/formation protein HypE [bacterium]